MGDVVFRLLPTGEQQIIKLPDMSNVKWSKAQKAHRQRFKRAMAEPKAQSVYEKMAVKKHKRPFDMAVSDYFKGNDLISKK